MMYIKPFDQLSSALKRRMLHKHRLFHEIDETKYDMWEQRVCDLLDGPSAAVPLKNWYDDPANRGRPIEVLSSFTFGAI